jgi:NADPH:quinone reductase-like Zn-dependent oxidoreductase
MKAVICPQYGPPEVLQIRNVEKPYPKNNEVLIKIFATAVTASDIFIRSSNVPIFVFIPMRFMLGICKPRQAILGLVIAGKIELIGKDIKRFKIGDEVFGLTGFGMGAYAEYKCMKEVDSTSGCLALKPKNISYEEATVAAYGGLLAFQSLEKAHISPKQNVLIYGASGASGTIAIQLAKYFGASVTGVCSTTNINLVKSIGADLVIDYTQQDNLNPEIKYDVILDSVGKMKTSKFKVACKKALTKRGKYISIDDEKLLLDSDCLNKIKDLIEGGRIKPIIDKVYSIDNIVEAHRYVEMGHKKGGVAIKAC